MALVAGTAAPVAGQEDELDRFLRNAAPTSPPIRSAARRASLDTFPVQTGADLKARRDMRWSSGGPPRGGGIKRRQPRSRDKGRIFTLKLPSSNGSLRLPETRNQYAPRRYSRSDTPIVRSRNHGMSFAELAKQRHQQRPGVGQGWRRGGSSLGSLPSSVAEDGLDDYATDFSPARGAQGRSKRQPPRRRSRFSSSFSSALPSLSEMSSIMSDLTDSDKDTAVGSQASLLQRTQLDPTPPYSPASSVSGASATSTGATPISSVVRQTLQRGSGFSCGSGAASPTMSKRGSDRRKERSPKLVSHARALGFEPALRRDSSFTLEVA